MLGFIPLFLEFPLISQKQQFIEEEECHTVTTEIQISYDDFLLTVIYSLFH